MPDTEVDVDDRVALARALGEYHRELLAQGFTRDEALAIVMNYQECVLVGVPITNMEPPNA